VSASLNVPANVTDTVTYTSRIQIALALALALQLIQWSYTELSFVTEAFALMSGD
jgi:hypothetical protein